VFKKSLIGVVLLLSLSISVTSADENVTKEAKGIKKVTQNISNDRIEAAKDLLKEMNLKSASEDAVDNFTTRLVEADSKFKKIEDKIREFYNKYIGWDSMKDDLAKLYAKHYTAEEIKDIIKFYKTKTGKKVLKNIGKLSYEGQMITREKLQLHIDELKDILKKATDDNKETSKKERK